MILSFSSKQKMDIAKIALEQMGVDGIGYFKEEFVLDQQKLERFINKDVFSQEEIFFVCKYLSHAYKGYGVLDLNTPTDYHIFSYIRQEKKQEKKNLILSTHWGLFHAMETSSREYTDYTVCFCDMDRRYKSYNAYISASFDFHYILQ